MVMGTVNNGFNKPKKEDYMSMKNLFKIYKISKLQESYLLIFR